MYLAILIKLNLNITEILKLMSKKGKKLCHFHFASLSQQGSTLKGKNLSTLETL